MSTSTLDLQQDARRDRPIGTDVRTAILEGAMALYRRTAFHDVTLQLVADETGVTRERVEELFPTRDDLMITTILTWNEQRMGPILPIADKRGAVALLRAIVLVNTQDGALMRLMTAAANIAATPGHPMAPTLQRQWVQFHAMVQRALAVDIQMGREPSTMEPPRGAEQLIALYEGLQLQSMMRPHMDPIEAYDRAVTRLRDGWSRTYAPPVWEI